MEVKIGYLLYVAGLKRILIAFCRGAPWHARSNAHSASRWIVVCATETPEAFIPTGAIAFLSYNPYQCQVVRRFQTIYMLQHF